MAPVALLLPALSGCWGIQHTVDDTEVLAQQSRQAAVIRQGETTRAEVRALLGEPWLGSAFWGVEVYRASDTEREAGLVFLLYVPVYGGVVSADWQSFVLVAYDEADRVSAVASGRMSGKGWLAGPGENWLMVRANGTTLATDALWKGVPLLLADGQKLAAYLDRQRGSGDCTLVLACEKGADCPDQLVVADGAPVNPGFVSLACPAGAPCPDGQLEQRVSLSTGEVMVVSVPVLHPVSLSPGEHTVQLGSRKLRGHSTVPVRCGPGEVLYGRISGAVTGGSWLRKGRLAATLTLQPQLPAEWSDYSIALWRQGRWIAEP